MKRIIIGWTLVVLSVLLAMGSPLDIVGGFGFIMICGIILAMFGYRARKKAKRGQENAKVYNG